MSQRSYTYLDNKLEKERAYWLQKLSGDLVVSGIPLDFKRPAKASFDKERVKIKLDSKSEFKLRKISGGSEPLILTALITALKICLQRYTGIQDIIIGTTIHNKYSEVTSINKILALRDQVRPSRTVKQLLLEVKETLSEAYSNQKYPFESILDLLNVERPANRMPLFNIAAVLENTNDREHIRHLNNDVTLSFRINSDSITGAVEYNPTLFTREAIEIFSSHYEHILEAAFDSPEVQISSLQLLSEAKRQAFLISFNATESDYPKLSSVAQVFEDQVRRTPDNEAVVFENSSVTYQQLDDRANEVALLLKRLGVGRGANVGIYLEHSIEIVVALLGVLKAGAAYVPLDPDHPKQRLGFVIADAEISVILTQQNLADELPTDGAMRVCLDSELEAVSHEAIDWPLTSPGPDDTAYLIYTSGSTGVPKGVRISHKALVNYTWWAKQMYLKEGKGTFALYSSLAFDLTVTSIYTPLLSGNKIIVFRKDGNDFPLAEILKDDRVEILKLTPSHLSLIKDRDNSRSRISRMIVGGEALETELTRQIQSSFSQEVEIFNEYGPTEATVGCMIYKFDAANDNRTHVPIGVPAANAQIYLLDKSLNPVAENMVGELYISGDGLAQGYHNRLELSSERFIPNPFLAGKRMYKTGDLARRLASRDLEYVGRTDDQVKFHGYRVELNDIRAALNKHPRIRESVVVVRKDKNDNDVMMAYYASRQELDTDELRDFLSEVVIRETIPSLFVHLRKLPLTLNGKVNVEVLPSLEEVRQKARPKFVAPRTHTEEALVAIWRDVLGIAEVGIYDNFFELGGHSLLATQVISRIREVFQVDLPLRSLFESPTISTLLETLEKAMSTGQMLQVPTIKRVQRDGDLPLSFAQQRLWFIDQLEPGSPIYNVHVPVRLIARLNIAALEQTLTEIVRRHEILRTTFPAINGRPVQVIAAAKPVQMPLIDLTGPAEEARDGEAQRLATEEVNQPFNLAEGPLLRVRLLRLREDEFVVLFTTHHIVSDGWSMEILMREVSTLYAAFSNNQPSPLPELAIQYVDFAHWQQQWLQGEMLESHLSYWRKQLRGPLPVLALPTDRPRPAAQTFNGSRQRLVLTESLTEALRQLCVREGVTPFMTLLAAFKVLLFCYTGQDDVIVGSNIAHRNLARIEDLIGFFVNNLVLRTDMSGNPTFSELLRRVHEVCLSAYTHQDMPFDKLVEELQPERNLSHNPLFQVMFNLHNTRTSRPEVPGLGISPMDIHTQTSRFDLVMNMWETPQKLIGSLEYNTDLFDAETIIRMLGYFETLLDDVVAHPDKRLDEISPMTGEENDQLIHAFNSV